MEEVELGVVNCKIEQILVMLFVLVLVEEEEEEVVFDGIVVKMLDCIE